MVTRRERAARAARPAAFDMLEGKTAVFLPHFPDWTFSADAYFGDFLPSGAKLNTHFKIVPSGRGFIFTLFT